MLKESLEISEFFKEVLDYLNFLEDIKMEARVVLSKFAEDPGQELPEQFQVNIFDRIQWKNFWNIKRRNFCTHPRKNSWRSLWKNPSKYLNWNYWIIGGISGMFPWGMPKNCLKNSRRNSIFRTNIWVIVGGILGAVIFRQVHVGILMKIKEYSFGTKKNPTVIIVV